MDNTDPAALQDLSRLSRFILGEPAIDEKIIEPGMNICYAQGTPAGWIMMKIVTVKDVADGTLKYGLRRFRGVNKYGERGSYSAALTHRLDAPRLVMECGWSSSDVFDEERLVSSNTVVQYDSGRRVLTYKYADATVKMEETGSFSSNTEGGIVLMCKKGVDPRKMRFFPLGLREQDIDKNTRYYRCDDSSWTAVQEIPDGLCGDFTLPGFRRISEDLFQQLTSDRFVIPRRSREEVLKEMLAKQQGSISTSDRIEFLSF